AGAAFGGGGPGAEDFSGRCSAILSNGKRCPNAALPGSRFCGVPAHQALEGTGSDYVAGAPPAEADETEAEPVEAEVAVEETEPVAEEPPADGDEPPVAPEAGEADDARPEEQGAGGGEPEEA